VMNPLDRDASDRNEEMKGSARERIAQDGRSKRNRITAQRTRQRCHGRGKNWGGETERVYKGPSEKTHPIRRARPARHGLTIGHVRLPAAK
jgi:hypothetical protein